MTLDARVFNEVKRNRLMTGPALLLTLIAFGLAAVNAASNELMIDLVPGPPLGRGLIALTALYTGWAIDVEFVHQGATAHAQNESSTVGARVLGFALAPLALLAFAVLPRIGPVIAIVAVLLEALAFLIASRSALHASWTAALAILAAGLALTAIAVVAGWFMLGGITITFESLFKMLQLSP